MRVKYVLRLDGQIIESNSEKELRRIVENTECYWEIWKHIIPSVKYNDGNQKLTIFDIDEMLEMRESGVSIKTIAKKFNITTDWVKKTTAKRRLQKLKISLPII